MPECLIYSVGCEALRIEFDRRCSTERRHDPLTIMDNSGRPLSIRSGRITLSMLVMILSNLQEVWTQIRPNEMLWPDLDPKCLPL